MSQLGLDLGGEPRLNEDLVGVVIPLDDGEQLVVTGVAAWNEAYLEVTVRGRASCRAAGLVRARVEREESDV